MKKMCVLAAVVFFTLSLVSVVVAEEETGGYWGEIQSIDYNARTMTMKSFSPMVSPDVTGGITGTTFRMDETSNIIKCDTNRDFQDIKVGEYVQIRYREKNKKYFVESVDVKSSITACKSKEKSES